jgi:hypothetical protein
MESNKYLLDWLVRQLLLWRIMDGEMKHGPGVVSGEPLCRDRHQYISAVGYSGG